MKAGHRIAATGLAALVGLAPLPSRASISDPALGAALQTLNAEEPDWRTLPFFRHDYGGWFRIWTNENTFDKGVRIVNGSRSEWNPNPGPTTEESSTEFQVLWNEKCQRVKAQTFRTTREVYFPGLANKLEVSLGAYSSHAKNKPSPVDSVKLLVNGISVHEVRSAPGNPIPYETEERVVVDIKSASLKFGLNRLTFVGHKKATKKALRWCKGDNDIGILGEVYGEFFADIAVTAPKTVDGGEIGFVLPVTVTNHGPSDLIAAPGTPYFSASASLDKGTISNIYVNPSEGCEDPFEFQNGSVEGMAVMCLLPRMSSGTSITFEVGVEYGSPPPAGYTVKGMIGADGYADNTDERYENNVVNFQSQLP